MQNTGYEWCYTDADLNWDYCNAGDWDLTRDDTTLIKIFEI